MALAYMLLLAYYNVFGINYTEWQLHPRYVFKVRFLMKTRKLQLFFSSGEISLNEILEVHFDVL